jgi:phycobilisome rod-core linker protein
MDSMIEKAYRQVFFHAMSSDREPFLESQLRSGNITVRDFIRGLLLSERFQQGYFQCSSNYRMVDQVVGRVLGRPVLGDAERRAWSIVIGEKGFTNFIDSLLDSREYMDSFGYDLVPQQRSRVLPGRALGETPIYQQFPRYGSDWRDSLQDRAPSDQAAQMQLLQTSAAWVNGQPPAFALKLWLGLALVGGFELGRVILTIAFSMLRS